MAEQETPSLAAQITAIRRAEERLYQMVPYPPHSEARALHAILSLLERLEKLEKLAAQLKWIAEERQYGRDASLTAWENLWRLLAALEAQEANDGR